MTTPPAVGPRPAGRNWWPWLPVLVLLATVLANIALIRLALQGDDRKPPDAAAAP